MRSLLVAIALAAVSAGCAAPAPTVGPAVLDPVAVSGPPPTASPTPRPTPRATEAHLPAPPMPAFDDPYPDGGWVVASAVDATGDPKRVISYGWVKAGALLDLAYACEQTTKVSVLVSDGRPEAAGATLFGFETICSPGEIGRSTAPSTTATMPIYLDVGVDPAVRFWAKLGVPTDDLLH